MGVRIADEYGAMKPIVAPVRAPAAAGAVGLIRAAPAPAGAAVAVNEDAAALAAEPPLEGGVEESEAAPWPSASEEAAFLSGAPEGVAAVLAMPLAETPPTEKLAPLPPLEELIQRVPPAVREALDDLFRAKFTSVRRV